MFKLFVNVTNVLYCDLYLWSVRCWRFERHLCSRDPAHYNVENDKIKMNEDEQREVDIPTLVGKRHSHHM